MFILHMIDHAIGRFIWWLFNLQEETHICQMCGLTFPEFDLIDIVEEDDKTGRKLDWAACDSCATKFLMDFVEQGAALTRV